MSLFICFCALFSWTIETNFFPYVYLAFLIHPFIHLTSFCFDLLFLDNQNFFSLFFLDLEMNLLYHILTSKVFFPHSSGCFRTQLIDPFSVSMLFVLNFMMLPLSTIGYGAQVKKIEFLFRQPFPNHTYRMLSLLLLLRVLNFYTKCFFFPVVMIFVVNGVQDIVLLFVLSIYRFLIVPDCSENYLLSTGHFQHLCPKSYGYGSMGL